MAGGEVAFHNDDPEHVLTVIRNGVDQNTPFKMVEHRQDDFIRLRITPDGHSFRRPTVLTMSYEDCHLVNSKPLKIFRYNPTTQAWDGLDSFHNPNDKTVSAAIGTLSDYAMGTD